MDTSTKIAHNSIIQLIGKMISTILGLLAIGMMTRLLGVEGFGWYTSAIGLLQFIGILTDFGMTPVTVKLLSETEEDKQSGILANLLGFRLVSAIIIFGITPFIAMALGYSTIIIHAVAILSIGFIGIAMNQVFLGLYQTKLRLITHSIGEIIGRLVLVIGIWQLSLRGADFLPIMWVITLSAIIFTLVLSSRARSTISMGIAFDIPVWKKIFREGWPISLAIIFNVVYLKGDIIILNWFVSQQEIGLYGAAYRVLDVLTQAAMMLMGIFLPLLSYHWSRNLLKDFTHFYRQAFDTLMIFAIPMTFGGVILGTPIIRLIAGVEFQDAGPILSILTIAVFGVYLGAIFGHTAVAIGRQHKALWVYLIGAIITLTGYLIFIPRYGIYGAAYMTVFSELFVGTMLYLLIRRYSGAKLRISRSLKSLIASIIMSIILINLPQNFLILNILISIFVYLIILISLRTIPISFIKSLSPITLSRNTDKNKHP